MRNQSVSPISAYSGRAGAGDTSAKGEYVMENLLGEDLDRLAILYADGNKIVHLYGKTDQKYCKMGHVTYQT